ncbi:hypothetical protein PKHYL_21230 [Psychrobacter sp. KH172YL61]|nr:M14-type cytosolic carboxypeptidase [Psychrobacter sp. KH172YL61]BBI67932.1 hypothetical protein PKHYL_21230 [Psychrobacter sp. KH172YL61]
MRITANFDAGNIDVLNIEDKNNIQLAIRPDVGEEFFNGLTSVSLARLEGSTFSIL